MAPENGRNRIRLRRLDKYNLVIERERQGESGRWAIEGFYSSFASLLRVAVKMGVSGDDAKQLLASVKDAESHVLMALGDAVACGAFWETRA